MKKIIVLLLLSTMVGAIELEPITDGVTDHGSLKLLWEDDYHDLELRWIDDGFCTGEYYYYVVNELTKRDWIDVCIGWTYAFIKPYRGQRDENDNLIFNYTREDLREAGISEEYINYVLGGEYVSTPLVEITAHDYYDQNISTTAEVVFTLYSKTTTIIPCYSFGSTTCDDEEK